MRFKHVRVVVVALAVSCVIALFAFRSGFISEATETSALVPIIGATKSVAVAVGNADGDADPGETLEYTVTINNTGPDPAIGVSLSDTLQNITTFVAGSTIASPIAVNDSYASIGNVGINVPDGVSDLLANDLDANNPGVNTALVIVAPVPTTSVNGGNVAINTATGAFTYTPAPGFTGNDSFTYTLGNGTGLTNTATVSITVSGMIWFVDENAVSNGDGRLGTPFSTLANFVASTLDEANDNIFLYESATGYSGGITLLTGQKLIGQDSTSTLSSISGVTIPTFSNVLPVMNSGNATFTNLTGTTTLNTNTVVRGLRINSTTSTGLNDPIGAITGVSVSEIATIATTTGTAVLLSSNGGTYSITNVSSSGATNGISLTSTTGSFTVTGSSAGLCGGSVSAGPPASAATVTAPNTADCTGGTIQNSTGPGIVLNNAQNISFTRIRVLNGGNDGVQGTNVTGFSLISSLFDNNGNAINESGLDFGDTTSITPDGLHGTGVITNSTIQNSYYNGASIRNLSGAALTSFNITGSQFRGSPTDLENNDLVFMEAMGTANMAISVTGSFFASTEGDHIQTAGVNSGTLNVNIANNTLTGGHSTGLGQGITINAATGVAFGGWTGRIDYDVNGNHINGSTSNAVAVVLGTSGAAGVFDGFVRNNRIGTSGLALSCSAQANGVYIDARGNGTHNSSVTGNTIRQCFDRGILSEAGDGDPVLNLTVTGNTIDQQVGALTREAIQTNHGITSTNVFGNVDTPVVCLQLGGAGALANIFSHGAGAPDDFRLRKRFEATVRLPGYAGGTGQDPGSLAAVVAFVQGQNTGSAGEPGSASASGTGGGYTGGAPCAQPSFTESVEEKSLAFIGFDNDLSFVKANYDEPLAFLTDIVALSGDLASLRSAQSPLRGVQSPLRSVQSPLRRSLISDVSATLGEFAGKLGEMISPTVNAQDKTPPEGGTPNAPESGETVTKALGTIPSGEGVTVRFRAMVDNGPYASGVNAITNQAAISGNFATVNTNTTSINLDAAPDLVVTKTEGGATTQPSGTVVYTLSYTNPTAVNGQNAANVVLTETVPLNTTFNISASAPTVWAGCADGAPAGTVCTLSIGNLNAGAPAGTATFAVNLAAALPAGLTQVSNTSSIAESPNVNGPDRNTGNNSGPDTTNIIGNWDGSAGALGFGDWNVAANWSNDVVPPAGNNVSIPNVANQPRVSSADVTLNNMFLNGENVNILTGRTITVNGQVTLGANIVDGAGTLALGAAAPAISRSTGQVNATLSKTFSGAGPFIYTVGTAGQYSPVNVVVNSGAGTLSVRANTGTVPATIPANPLTTLQRYWTLNGSGIFADVTFNYLQSDVAGNENNYRIMRVSGGNKISLTNVAPCPGSGSRCVDPGANTIFVRNLSVFSDWTASELAPTAANVSVSGRVLTPEGNGAMRSVVTMTDQNGNTVYSTANHFGYFRFVNIPAGQSYVLAVTSKRYIYRPQSISVVDDVAGLEITPDQ